VAFLVIFIAILGFFGAQFMTAPSSVTGQAQIRYYPNGTSYLAIINDRSVVSIDNKPTFNVSSLACTITGDLFSGFGIPDCAGRYVNNFLAFTTMSSTNTILAIILGILTIILAWAVLTLWGG
jgi:hypothetical protein